ncbi:MAG: hypothetical protein LBQ98_10060 [Nitrososphaerota archaeon]|jgi:Zn-finger nucleic acid-binding protein|nr:hypothetical protein [Nitrososphaerota archaeon]
MSENNQPIYKCPHCACVFLTQVDLQKHIVAFGSTKEQHEYNYKKNHGSIEYGYSED